MQKKEVQKILAGLFVPRAEGLEGLCFNSDCMKDDAVEYPVYKAVSDAQYSSNLTHGFSYEKGSRAADILADAEDWEDDDALQEAIDSAVPIYTGEIMQIYNSDSWAVDEAAEEFGDTGDSSARAVRAWYMQIQSMVEAIKNNLAALIEEPDAV